MNSKCRGLQERSCSKFAATHLEKYLDLTENYSQRKYYLQVVSCSCSELDSQSFWEKSGVGSGTRLQCSQCADIYKLRYPLTIIRPVHLLTNLVSKKYTRQYLSRMTCLHIVYKEIFYSYYTTSNSSCRNISQYTKNSYKLKSQ